MLDREACMPSQNEDLAIRLALRLAALHAANGDDWTATSHDALALIRESHRLEPLPAGGTDGRPDGGGETPDTPREDD